MAANIFILKYPVFILEINFGHWQALFIQHIYIFGGTHHPLTNVRSSNTMWCHSTQNYHNDWMLDRRQNAPRAKRFMRPSSSKVVSSKILDSKGALDFIPILTWPVQMLFFSQTILAFLCYSETFGFFFALLPLEPLPSNLFRIVDVNSSIPVLWGHSLRSSELVRRRSDSERLTRALSCQMVDFIFLPLPGLSSNFPVSFHRFIVKSTPVLEQPTSDAIFHSDVPFWCR